MMSQLDSPHWSWFHGCRKHRGQPAPCGECLRSRDPDVTQDGHKMFVAPAKEPAALKVDKERVEHWRKRGAQISPTVKSLIKKAK